MPIPTSSSLEICFSSILARMLFPTSGRMALPPSSVTVGREKEYDRLGLEENYMEYLGNKVVCYDIPIRPGRNLAVICESAAGRMLFPTSGRMALPPSSVTVGISHLSSTHPALSNSPIFTLVPPMSTPNAYVPMLTPPRPSGQNIIYLSSSSLFFARELCTRA